MDHVRARDFAHACYNNSNHVLLTSTIDNRGGRMDWKRLPYSGKFSYGANFCIFRMLHPLYENKNCENLNV